MNSTKFKCPKCGGPTQVVDSRPKGHSATRRRRLCLNLKCGHRVTTVERIFIEEKFDIKPEKRLGTAPLYLFTTPVCKNFFRVIEAQTRKKAKKVAVQKGWTKSVDWDITYLGFPAREEA